MKKLIFPLLFALAALSCNKDKLLKDVNVYIGTDLLANPMSIHVLDANPDNAPGTPAGLSIEIGGPDRDKIFSILGEKAVKMDGPFLNLGIRRLDAPSDQKPLWFIVTARAPGYLDASHLFSISDTSIFKVESMPMIKISAPPEGVTVTETVFQVDGATGVTDIFNLKSDKANGVDQQTSIAVAKGTKMFAEGNSTPLSGAGKATIVQFSPNAVGNFVPDGAILESNGKQKKPGSTAPASAFVINMTVGGSAVSTFSNPIEATVELDKNLINPQTQTILTVGDSLPIWSYHESTATWHLEPKVKIASATGGKLTATVAMPHLSVWNAGFFEDFVAQLQGVPAIGGGVVPPGAAGAGATWKFASVILPECPGYYYSEIRTLGGARLFSGELSYFNGKGLKLSSILVGAPAIVRLQIFDGSADLPGAVLFEQVLGTAGDQVVALGAALPVHLTARLDVSGTCDLSDQILPTVPVSFREARAENDSHGWKTLGYVVRGRGCTQRLQKGSKYDFRVPQFPVPVWAITIPASDADIPIKGLFNYNGVDYNIDEVLGIRYTGVGGNEIELNYRNVNIPDDICDELRRLLGK